MVKGPPVKNFKYKRQFSKPGELLLVLVPEGSSPSLNYSCPSQQSPVSPLIAAVEANPPFPLQLLFFQELPKLWDDSLVTAPVSPCCHHHQPRFRALWWKWISLIRCMLQQLIEVTGGKTFNLPHSNKDLSFRPPQTTRSNPELTGGCAELTG